MLTHRLPDGRGAAVLDNPDSYDVIFLAEGKPLRAHRCILTARCEAFRGMFNSHMREGSGGCHEVPVLEVSYAAFRAMLLYIYGGAVHVPEELADAFFRRLVTTIQARGFAQAVLLYTGILGAKAIADADMARDRGTWSQVTGPIPAPPGFPPELLENYGAWPAPTLNAPTPAPLTDEEAQGARNTDSMDTD